MPRNRFGTKHQFLGNSLVTMSVPSAAQLGEFGVDPSWSKFVDVPSHSGGTHRWHILERPGMGADAPTILCIHGNPTWSFLWSRLMSEIGPAFRVLAPDQSKLSAEAFHAAAARSSPATKSPCVSVVIRSNVPTHNELCSVPARPLSLYGGLDTCLELD